MNKSIISIILFISTFCVGSMAWAGGILPPHVDGCDGSPSEVADQNTYHFPGADDPADCETLCGGWKQMCTGLAIAAKDCIKDSAASARKLAAQECNTLSGAAKTACTKAVADEIADINNDVNDDLAVAKDICSDNKEYCIMECEDDDSISGE